MAAAGAGSLAVARDDEPARAPNGASDGASEAEPARGGDVLELRGGSERLEGEILDIGPEGVRILVNGQAIPSWVGWDRVRRVHGAMASEAEAYAEVADTAWRARTRLERGDAASAEPLFESLFARYAGGEGPTARVVAEGLLRCRLRRNAYASAVEAWVAAQLAGVVGFDPSAAAVQGEGLALRLVPALPPIWTDAPGVRPLASGRLLLGEPREAGDGEPATGGAGIGLTTRALAAWYRAAAAHEAGVPIDHDELRAARASSDPEVTFVRAVVESRIGDGDVRAGARALLEVYIEAGVPRWAEAWARAAIGRSLLMEDEHEYRLLGVAELMHMPARLRDAQPYLAGLGLAESAAALDSMGQHAEADRVRAEFRRNFPGHPLLASSSATGRRVGTGSGGSTEGAD
ncbi:MAG: hypothetical protein EA378_11165 [Phycisphaerales bacterium]|nr:MAG: hypothetical protein EA378_11165 [Phycisphaerales bacterium]